MHGEVRRRNFNSNLETNLFRRQCSLGQAYLMLTYSAYGSHVEVIVQGCQDDALSASLVFADMAYLPGRQKYYMFLC
jgi:hypothetical protein